MTKLLVLLIFSAGYTTALYSVVFARHWSPVLRAYLIRRRMAAERREMERLTSTIIPTDRVFRLVPPETLKTEMLKS